MAVGSSGAGLNTIKLENPAYYTTYTSPVPDHTLMPASYTTYMERADSPLAMGRPHDPHSPMEPRSKRVRRVSSEEDPLEKAELAYYSQSPASLTSHAPSWHTDLDHVLPPMSLSSSVMGGAPSYYHDAGPPSPTKYHENGHDTFSDFVTLVCQEAQNTQHTQQQASPPGVARSPSKTQGGYYTTGSMLPPPPPPPMARPVAIIRSTADLAHSGSVSPGPVSPPNSSGACLPDVSPPDRRDECLSPQPPSTSAPPPSQLFTYSNMSPVSAMSGVISPTSMSLFTSPGSTPRTTPRSTPPAVPRWNTPFISLDENMDYTTMSTLMPSLPADAASAHLIEDAHVPGSHGNTGAEEVCLCCHFTHPHPHTERYFTTVVHPGDAAAAAQGPSTPGPQDPLDDSPGAPHTPTKTQAS
ncbi:hypothetical protein GWK47_017451 [Chionoecetes opilio]|uniref:Uncharacterized protein n=1 Tax=Chionoecetes opilio TaxID=41210 RepID=A0A8J4XRF6_CHIOP|nr:hypothetical protein GWK47_017451 [Chionoecetes opilio]